MNIIKKIKELNLPSDKYVIIGSGILNVLGIRPAIDIDISVTKDLFIKLMETGVWEKEEKYGKIFLKKGIFEINPGLEWENYKTTTEEANRTAMFLEGIPFMNLDELCIFKQALGREKDIKDITLIKMYQESHKNTKGMLSS